MSDLGNLDMFRDPDSVETSGELQQMIEKRREAQAKHYKKHSERWISEKKMIDEMSDTELKLYINSSSADDIHAQRIGTHTMRINSHEYALINLVINTLGSKSSRELFVKYCESEARKVSTKRKS